MGERTHERVRSGNFVTRLVFSMLLFLFFIFCDFKNNCFVVVAFLIFSISLSPACLHIKFSFVYYLFIMHGCFYYIFFYLYGCESVLFFIFSEIF